MVTNIIQIGNSKGIILPSEVLKQLRLSLKSAVSISLDGNNIVIKAQPRQGWAEADRNSTRLNSSHPLSSRMPSSA